MLSVLKKYITDRINLPDPDWNMIAAVCNPRKLRRQQYLLQEGEVWRYNAFIAQGCLRRYRVDERGVEHILQFSIENWWAGDRDSLMNGTPSKYYIDAIEPSEVVLIRKDDFDGLCKALPAFNELVNNILQRSLNASEERIHAAISLTAEEKYLHFINTHPQLANRVPRHMLASYLGITPETLSRVKRQASGK